LSQVTSVENANVALTAITVHPIFRTANALRAIATWQEVWATAAMARQDSANAESVLRAEIVPTAQRIDTFT